MERWKADIYTGRTKVGWGSSAYRPQAGKPRWASWWRRKGAREYEAHKFYGAPKPWWMPDRDEGDEVVEEKPTGFGGGGAARFPGISYPGGYARRTTPFYRSRMNAIGLTNWRI